MLTGLLRVAGGAVSIAVVAMAVGVDEGCGCDSARCVDSTVIVVHTASDVWPAGTYSIEVSAGSLDNTCTFVVTEPMSDQVEMTCTTTDPEMVIGSSARTIADDAGLVADYANVPSTLELEVTVLGSTPPQITVTVTRNGQPAGGGTLSPQYRTVERAPYTCGPTCQSGTLGDILVEG